MRSEKLRGRITQALISGIAGIVLVFAACGAAQAPVQDSPADLVKKGEYATAISLLAKSLEANPADEEARGLLLRAYLETGKYAEAESLAQKSKSPSSRLALTDVYTITGRYQQALAEADAIALGATGVVRLQADMRRARLLKITGKDDLAAPILKSFIEHYNSEKEKKAEDLTLVAEALAALEKYKEANDVIIEATNDDDEYIEAQLFGGELYTSKYNYAEAADFIKSALEINPHSARAHLAAASNKSIEGREEMNQELDKALETNPNYTDALVLKAWNEVEGENYDRAGEIIEAALKVNPNSLDARSLKAALFWLQDRKTDTDSELTRVLAINPRFGRLYETLSHFATQTRRYAEAADFSKRAIELTPNLWDAHLNYGTALTRLGKVDQGRQEIETGFKGDPFNLRAKNTLDLLDVLAEYPSTTHGEFVIRAAPEEKDTLTPYAASLLSEAFARLSAKYHFKPQAPITIEIYKNHEDFAVRTLGLPGLGALGVCFGQVVTLDSPSARKAGEFNWGSTLWHEFTHVITLQATNNRIPRWFSEGLSVYEERRARPGWGDDWNMMVLKAFADGRWFRISELDGGFLRPKSAESVPLAYFEASQVCEFVTEKYGFEKIVDLLAQFKTGIKTGPAIKNVLNLTEDQFDKEFDGFLRQKIGRYLKAGESIWKTNPQEKPDRAAILAAVATRPDDFVTNLRAGTLLKDEDQTKAITYLRKCVEVFPFYTGEGNPYTLLAQIYAARKDKPAEAAILTDYIRIDENDYDAAKRLALLRADLGDKQGELEALKLSFFISPFDPALHMKAGDVMMELNDPKGALVEYTVGLQLKPVNLAEAHYNLARAQFADGNRAAARKSLLQSLELAPSYGKALELLLKLKAN